MEELKKMAADFGLKYAEKHELIKKKSFNRYYCGLHLCRWFPILTCDVTWDGLKNEIDKIATEFVDKNFEGIDKANPLYHVLFMCVYDSAIKEGIKERDKFVLERDENGNIIGISTNKN